MVVKEEGAGWLKQDDIRTQKKDAGGGQGAMVSCNCARKTSGRNWSYTWHPERRFVFCASLAFDASDVWDAE